MELLSTAKEWRLMDEQGNPLAQHPYHGILPQLGSGRAIPGGYPPGVYHVVGHEFLELGGLGVSTMGVDRLTGTVLLDGQPFFVRIVGPPQTVPSIRKADPSRGSDPVPG